MKLMHFDTFSGASGDMILGALLDLGLSAEALAETLNRLGVGPFAVEAKAVTRQGIGGTRCALRVPPDPQPRRGLREIEEILLRADLPETVRERSLRVFQRLAEAEGRVHRIPPEAVHFHELGALDALADVVGAVAGLQLLGVERVLCSPLPLGSGFVETAHGRLPVPAPATAELLQGFPTAGGAGEGEITTPTAAAILTTLSEAFGPCPPMTLERVGYGAGEREGIDRPNLLRALLGAPLEIPSADRVVLIETTIDDMSPQLYEAVQARCYAAGALEAWLTPVQMKKGRPGVVLSVLAEEARTEGLTAAIFEETTTIGLRISRPERRALRREIREVSTPYGTVRVKVSAYARRVLTATPEYEEVRRLAEEAGVPVREVLSAAQAAARLLLPRPE
jgi:uncharacterized protein (TIGR00299 family) protein